MRQITKSKPPQPFLSYRLSEGACYDGLSKEVKEHLRDSLLLEQGHLCCYCMSRVSAENMRIEHWKPQSSKDRELDYGNLLAACDGNEGRPPQFQHCDVRKGDRELKYNPAEASHNIEVRIRYRGDGVVYSDDSEFDAQLNDVLNLNYQDRHPCSRNQRVQGRLVKNRKAAIDGIHAALANRPGSRTRRYIERKIEELGRPAGGMLPEYSGVTLYFLKKRLRAV